MELVNILSMLRYKGIKVLNTCLTNKNTMNYNKLTQKYNLLRNTFLNLQNACSFQKYFFPPKTWPGELKSKLLLESKILFNLEKALGRSKALKGLQEVW